MVPDKPSRKSGNKTSAGATSSSVASDTFLHKGFKLLFFELQAEKEISDTSESGASATAQSTHSFFPWIPFLRSAGKVTRTRLPMQEHGSLAVQALSFLL